MSDDRQPDIQAIHEELDRVRAKLQVLEAVCGALFAHVAMNTGRGRESLTEMLARITGLIQRPENELDHVKALERVQTFAEARISELESGPAYPP